MTTRTIQHQPLKKNPATAASLATLSPDPGFGSGGVVIHDSAAGGGGNDFGFAPAIDAVGDVLVAGGSTNSSGDLDLSLCRYR